MLGATDAKSDAAPTRLRFVGARRLRLGVLLLSISLLAGCAGGGGTSGGTTADSVVAIDPIFLDPGLTVAELAWAPSEGPVDNYLVFESRNGAEFAFSTIALTPSVDITGAPGDEVQITVVAISPTGAMSDNSPPSPPLIFQASTDAVTAEDATDGLVATPSTLASEDATPDAPQVAATETPADATPETSRIDTTADVGEDEMQAATTRLVQSLRALLLGGDARLPESGLSTDAHDWLQARVDVEIAAGVALAGTGRADDDALRELVWQDPAGQLFVSDGEAFLDATDLPATFAEGVRLNATERFVGLADFDGDGLGDWLLEDTATGDVWIVDGADDQAQPPAPAAERTTLAGQGDFDGDGVAELLWIDADRNLSLTSASLAAPTLVSGSGQPTDTTLLAIADFDGNGRDDLLTRTGDGVLVIGFTVATPVGAPIVLDWQTGAPLSDAPLELIATVDVDDDGAAEIAWLNDDDLEIWTAEGGLQQRLAL